MEPKIEMTEVAKVVRMSRKFPYANTPVQLTFEAEIQRMYSERNEPMATIIEKLAKLSGVEERQIYNYRNGKTAIAPEQIKIFCEQFQSVALGMAWFSTFEIEKEQNDLFDLCRFVSKTVRNVLTAGDDFMGAFEDGKIDSFEMNKLEIAGAKIHRDTNLLIEIARNNHHSQNRTN